jgi:hypothetical protein
MFGKQRARIDRRAELTDTLKNRATEWEKLAAAARQREDEGPQNALRECRPYPPGYWTGMAQGLETAARELRDLLPQ